jgi:pyruvate,water dikinase
MSNIISIDEFVNDPGYPGFEDRFFNSPWIAEPVSKFRAEDVERFWFLDFHWPKGTTPLGMCYFEDGYAFATQQAATTLPLPPSNGLAVRFGGVHVFGGESPLKSTWEPGFRGMRIGNELGGILERFNETWAKREAELTAGFSHFRDYDTDRASMGDMAQFAQDARAFQKFAWVTHFGLMYPLLANYAGFYGLCNELKIAPGEIAKFLQGERTKIIETDVALWGLTKRAKELGVADHVSGTPDQMRAAMDNAGPNGATWMGEYQAFMNQWGWRCAGIADPLEKPWIEDPQQVVGLLETFLQKDTAHDFDGGLSAAAQERDAAVAAARAKLTQGEQGAFDQALAGCRMANFSWWNEDHNVVIDMQATIPLRRAAHAIAEKAGADDPDDGCFLFHPELVELAEGKTNWKALKSVVQDRKDYYAHWNSRRKEMPKVVGTVPDSVQDPILIEIVGLHDKFLAAQRGEVGTELAGIPASKGEVTGIARVMHNADELHLLNPGDILVCEGTAPSWTPAFTKIGGCVCDNGGTLTHASIVSREYGLPCVVGTGVATSAIQNGDIVTVNGTDGTVQIKKQAA